MQKREVPCKCFGCVWLGLFVDMGARVPVCNRHSNLSDSLYDIDKDEDTCSYYCGFRELMNIHELIKKYS